MKYAKSLAELVVVAYVTSLVGLLGAENFDFLSLDGWKTAAAAAIPAAVAALYGALARFKGNYQSALAVDTRD